MQSFLDPLDLEYQDTTKEPQTFKVLQPFHYLTELGYTICVPAGFITDMASVPQVLWAILPPDGPYGKAAVVHDYLYRTGGRVDVSPAHAFSKAESDLIFYQAMGELGVSWWRRQIMYRAVQIFGGSSFKGEK